MSTDLEIKGWLERQEVWCAMAAAGNLEGMRELWAESLASAADDRARKIALVTRGTRHHMDALQRASLAGHAEVVRWLVEELGASPDGLPYEDYDEVLSGDTVHLGEQKELVAGPGRKHLARAMFWTGSSSPLHLAAAGGHAEVIRLLVALGARADLVAAANREQAHHAAAFHNRLDALRCLVDELGLDPGAPTDNGGTVLTHAAAGCAVDAFRWLEERLGGGGLTQAKADLLTGAATRVESPGERAMVDHLVDTHGATLTAFMLGDALTAGPRSVESFEYLMSRLEGGVAARDVRLPAGDTLLNRVAASNNVLLLRHLVEGCARVDPRVRCRLGTGPLTAAVCARAIGATRYLAEHAGGELLDPNDAVLRVALRKAHYDVRMAVSDASAKRAAAERGAVLALADAWGPLPVLDVARICASYVTDLFLDDHARRGDVRARAPRRQARRSDNGNSSDDDDGVMFDLFA